MGLGFVRVSLGVQRVVLAGLSALFALLAFGIFIREYNSFYSGSGVAAQFYVTSEGAFAAQPIGLQSISREVERCFAARAQLRGGVLTADARARGYRACLGLADGILRGTPAHGGALQLRAEMLADLGDSPAAFEALVLAAQAAPRTVWLMQRRVALALALADGAERFGNGQIAQQVAQDVAGLLGVRSVHDWLAQQYLRHAALRAVMGQLEGKVLAADGAAFLRQLRREIGQSGGAAP